jgi:predicted DNA-binding transcriptional regulator AlpA
MDDPRPESNRILSFQQWCRRRGISEATGRRILNSGQGPRVVRISQRRLGIFEADDDANLARNSVEPAAWRRSI